MILEELSWVSLESIFERDLVFYDPMLKMHKIMQKLRIKSFDTDYILSQLVQQVGKL